MSNGLVWFFFGLSIALFISAVVMLASCLRQIDKNRKNGLTGNVRARENRTVIALLLFFASIWSVRYIVGYYVSCNPSADNLIPRIGRHEEIINSVIHALQTFSMDEDYTEYLNEGKLLMKALVSGEGGEFLACFYSLYVSMLNIMAPIAGGALVFEILIGIFPKLRYEIVLRGMPGRELCLFSELNDRSLKFAESIVTAPKRGKDIIVFTDAYSDKSNEENSERLLSAKAFGAICLKDDILHMLSKRLIKRKVSVFLMDDDESNNIETLSAVLNRKDSGSFCKMKIYIFSSDSKVSYLEDEVAYIQNRKENQVIAGDEKEAAEKKEDARKKAREKMPFIFPINSARNMSKTLFYKYPLFESVTEPKTKGGKKIINVTILGTGVLGTELFLSAYWYGQILDCELCINVVSMETEESFRGRINYLNPEILAGEKYIKSTGTDEAEVEIRENENAYVNFRYFEKDIMSEDFDAFLSKPFSDDEGFCLLDTNYFIVALGSDSDNFSLADHLRRAVGRYHLTCLQERKTLIGCVIYDSAFSDMINGQPHFSCTADTQESDIYMFAFGSFSEIYSVGNSFFSNIDRSANSAGSDKQKNISANDADSEEEKVEGAGDAVPEEQNDGSTNDADSEEQEDGFDKIANDYYKKRIFYEYSAEVARRCHIKYKAYSAGYITGSLFSTASREEYDETIKKDWENYRKYIVEKDKKDEDIKILHSLAWLEHRRWNAFMRVNGFRCTENCEGFYALQNDTHDIYSHKWLMMKLHPCLVESDRNGIELALDEKGKVKEETQFVGLDSEKADELDKVSLKVKELAEKAEAVEAAKKEAKTEVKKPYNFKRWDYPTEDFGN